jgi:uroporphyrinogen-III decarboxylase
MNSIDRVKAAIHFQKPDRVPVVNMIIGDIFPLFPTPPKDWQPGHIPEEVGIFPAVEPLLMTLGFWKWNIPVWAKDPKFKHWWTLPHEEIDEFGTISESLGTHVRMAHPGRPILLDWKDLDHYFDRYHPDAKNPERYRIFTRISKLIAQRKYRIGLLSPFGPMMISANIRGFTNFLTDHYRHPIELKRLLSILTDFYVQQEYMWVKMGAKPHGFWMYEDLGEQIGPFFSPKLFREFYMPVYRRLIETAHELGCEFHLHSCGKVDLLLPMLMECGLDAIEFDSPRMNGYPALQPYRGKLMMWGCINIQSIYVNGTPDECQREVATMIKNLGTPDGGYGAYFYPQTNHIHVPKENVDAFKQGLKKYGTYAKLPKQWWDTIEFN